SVSKVDYNGTSGQKTGPSLLLKVMSGDTVSMLVQSYYNTNNITTTNSSLNDVLNSLATGLLNTATGHAEGSLPGFTSSSGPVYAAINSFLPTKDPAPPAGYPKAYLNWIFLDDQFNYISSASGSVQAASSTYPAATLNTVAPGAPISIGKNGYLYIWVSNETQGWDVFFDNLSVQYKQGPVLEENHYYPFGLAMVGISDKAVKTLFSENKARYNGKELQYNEFSDGTGLEEYDYGARMQDPQLGLWHNIDPMADVNRRWSPYVYAYNNPIRYIDPDGNDGVDVNGNWVDNGSMALDKGFNTITAVDFNQKNGKEDQSSDNSNENTSSENSSGNNNNFQNINFETLWNNYPGHHIDHLSPPNNKELYHDQCAIELSEALIKSGIHLNGYKGATCKNCSLKEKHALNAQQLANFLLHGAKIDGMASPKILTGANYESYVKGKTGIIYFEDYWHRDSDKKGERTGDHIDLWNQNALGSMTGYAGRTLNTWFRRNFPTFSENHLGMSDLTKSKRVIFWEIK
ncbi:MAG TPA: T6SS effector amidase Tae4 family protein, partial [Nitrosopumilaceae archaeon]|nr:T6SS effector amidase Tae4 family protein [Nitrosopumilaceae archaeon]